MLKVAMTCAVALFAAFLFVSSAAAQAPGAVEIGYDLGISFLMPEQGDDLVTLAVPRSVSVGVSTVRAGFYLSKSSELEPSLGLLLLSSGGSTATQLAIGLDYLHNFEGAHTRPFLMGGGRVLSLDNGSQSESQFGLGGGVGAKSTIGDRAAMRYSLELVRQFESDAFASRWDVGLSIGVSLFTK
jgi:hypothetical protein